MQDSLNYMACSKEEVANRAKFCCIFLTLWGLNLQPASAKFWHLILLKSKSQISASCYVNTVLADVNESCACITEGRFWPGLQTYENWHNMLTSRLCPTRPSDNENFSFVTLSPHAGSWALTQNTNQKHHLIQKSKPVANLMQMWQKSPEWVTVELQISQTVYG